MWLKGLIGATHAEESATLIDENGCVGFLDLGVKWMGAIALTSSLC
jgi:hypothetical protein